MICSGRSPITACPSQTESRAMRFCTLCATQPNILACHEIACGCVTPMQIVHRSGSILSSTFPRKNTSLVGFRLCSASVGLDPSDIGRQLEVKFTAKPIRTTSACGNKFFPSVLGPRPPRLPACRTNKYTEAGEWTDQRQVGEREKTTQIHTQLQGVNGQEITVTSGDNDHREEHCISVG